LTVADAPDAFLEDGRDLLREVAVPLGLWAAYASADANLPEPARRKALLGVIDATAARLRQLTIAFGRKALRRIPAIGGWAKDFLRNLGAGNMAGLMAATGTIDPAPADVVIVGKEIERQAGFLAKFRKQIAKGAVVLGSLVGPTGSPLPPSTPAASRPVSARVLSRAEMYGDAIWGGTQAVIRARMVREGYDEARRLLGGASQHCPDCPPLARLGWQPIEKVRAIGDTQCGPRCRCSVEYRHRESGRVSVPIGPSDPPAPASPLPLPPPDRPIPGPAGSGLTFTASDRSRRDRDKVVWVDVARLDAAWAKDESYYLAPGGDGPSAIKGRYGQAREFVAKARAEGIAFAMPQATVTKDGSVSFVDGRSRFAALRDLGLDRIPLAVDRAAAKLMARLFGAGN
jgi:hypothetical protein